MALRTGCVNRMKKHDLRQPGPLREADSQASESPFLLPVPSHLPLGLQGLHAGEGSPPGSTPAGWGLGLSRGLEKSSELHLTPLPL